MEREEKGKKKKTQETENGEDRDKRNSAKARTGFLKKTHVLFSRQSISSFHLLEVSSVRSHFIDEETEDNDVLLKV